MYLTQGKLRENTGNFISAGMWQPWGGLPQCMLGYHPPGTRHPQEQAPPQQMATVADGTHPTGMHSCFRLKH